jgi:hypothetical protein
MLLALMVMTSSENKAGEIGYIYCRNLARPFDYKGSVITIA